MDFNGESSRAVFSLLYSVEKVGELAFSNMRANGENKDKKCPVNDPPAQVNCGHSQKPLYSFHSNLNEPHLQMWPHMHFP